ncbi:MAG: dockerin type I repeat-containing protein [Acutalibacteraceae bacterium]
MKKIMKSIIASAATLALSLSAVGTAFASSENETEIIPSDPTVYKAGDVSLDGKIDLKDAILVQKYSLMLTSFTATQKSLGDINGDGKTNLSDAILLQKKVLNGETGSDKDDVIELPIIPVRR